MTVRHILRFYQYLVFIYFHILNFINYGYFYTRKTHQI